MYLFENQDFNIKKIQQSIKFQKKNRIQYIEFLEKRLKSLINENKNLKKYSALVNNNALTNNNVNNNENINNMNRNYIGNKNLVNNINLNCNNNYNIKQNAYINNNANYSIDGNNNIYKTPNVTDRKSNLKKIEIKKSNEYNKNSIKYSPYINRYDENLNNVKNLNAQTAFEQQYSNRQGNNINVNINDDNSARRSNYFMNNLSNRRSNNSSLDKNYIRGNLGKNRY